MADPKAPLPSAKSIGVFCAYSHKDEKLRSQLETHLSMLKRSSKISFWHDRRIPAGNNWKLEIDDHLNKADIILLLVSPDFLDSDYCYHKEATRALKRHNAGKARVIPVMLRDCDWEGAPFADCQGLPKDFKPVVDWKPRDRGFKDVAVGIRGAVQLLLTRKRRSSPRTPKSDNTVRKSARLSRYKNKLAPTPRIVVQQGNTPPRTVSRIEDPRSVHQRQQVSLKERVNAFVEWLFQGYQAAPPKKGKVINDPLLGNLFFARQEVAVIDCPILQRLRRIKQTGLVHYVYPSATHSRFEHSLGAAALSERCFHAVQERASVEGFGPLADADRSKGDLAHLRMAALLHDVGHGLCSHASEQIYELLSDLQDFKQDPAYATNAPGEILSYLIVTSRTFQSWFIANVVEGCGADLNLKTISQLILGKHDEKEKYFLANIISGPYDCDKLDYIARDSYYCGLALTVDLPRFYSMISTTKYKDYRVLVLRNYVPLEQILFSKMSLFASVYHHQKAKCLDSMLRSMIEHIVENPGQTGFPVRGGKTITFADPVEYLYATDEEFFGQADGFGDNYIQGMLTRFRHRDLFVRCMEISRKTVNNWDAGRQTLIDLTELPKELAELEAEIHKRLPLAQRRKCNKHDIRLSIPALPPLTGNALIRTSEQHNIEYIEKYFPVAQWTDAYAHNKWRSCVYAPREVAQAVRDTAASVLADYSKMDINLQESNQACHLP